MRVLCTLVTAASMAAACGGIVSGNDDGGTPDAGSTHPCPSKQPTDGTSCTREGLECEYGTNTDYLCNALSTCSGGSWSSSSPQPFCPSGLGPGCPQLSSDVPQGSTCNYQGTRCNYPDIVCECTTPAGPIQIDDAGNTVSSWVCEQPAQGCPIPRPNIGAPCAKPSTLMCDYGSCALQGGVVLSCVNGAWTRGDVACPL